MSPRCCRALIARPAIQEVKASRHTGSGWTMSTSTATLVSEASPTLGPGNDTVSSTTVKRRLVVHMELCLTTSASTVQTSAHAFFVDFVRAAQISILYRLTCQYACIICMSIRMKDGRLLDSRPVIYTAISTLRPFLTIRYAQSRRL